MSMKGMFIISGPKLRKLVKEINNVKGKRVGLEYFAKRLDVNASTIKTTMIRLGVDPEEYKRNYKLNNKFSDYTINYDNLDEEGCVRLIKALAFFVSKRKDCPIARKKILKVKGNEKMIDVFSEVLDIHPSRIVKAIKTNNS